MSGFSAELIDYLEGRITFEEFDQRREQRERNQADEEALYEDGDDDDAQPSTSCQSQLKKETVEDEVSPMVKQAFASMMGEGTEQPSSEEEDSLSYIDDEDDKDFEIETRKFKEKRCKKRVGKKRKEMKEQDGEQDQENLSVGEVFALEMELNRENKKMMKERRHRSKLSRALRGLMGEANIRYARGEKEDAILMCMEIIRQAPLAYEPFSTLAMIYEDDEDMEKSLQFGLIAAHLNPSDCDEWVKLADMSLELGNVRQAVVCYSKAIKSDPTNVSYLWERSSLHMQLGEHKQCMDGYRKILSLLPLEEGQHFMQLSKDMAKSYYDSNDLASALGVLQDALARHPDLVSDELVNMAAELYIANHQHNKALQVLIQFSGIVLVREEPQSASTMPPEEQRQEDKEGEEKEKNGGETESETLAEKLMDELGKITDVIVPDSVPVDIRAKLMVCLIHQHVYEPVEGMLPLLKQQSPEDVGDLHLDVAEALLEEGKYSSALPLLAALVNSKKYNLAVVWLRHAECVKALGMLDAAADSYTKVVEMAPQHLEARLCLSTLQQQLGRPQCALKALEPMYSTETLALDSSAAQKELKLLLHRSTLLKTQGQLQDYLDSVITMLAMLLKVAMQRAKVCMRSVLVSGKRHLRLVKVIDMELEITDQEAAYQDVSRKTNVLSREEWWHLLVSCLRTMAEVHRYTEAELLVDSAMEFYSFYENKPKRKELEFFGLSFTLLDHNHRRAYDYLRLMLIDNVELPQLWNIFNQITSNSQHQRHHRFSLRLMLKNPDNHALCVLCGHNAMVSGSFKHALGQYVQALRTHPNNPLYCLCVGLTFFHMASQKFVSKRHQLILQGFSFLWRYMEIRGECQESMYNLGRALQQLGLTYLAIHYYQKALTLTPLKLEGIADDQVDLTREIAFNLSLIYQACGNMDMARQLINKHCII